MAKQRVDGPGSGAGAPGPGEGPTSTVGPAEVVVPGPPKLRRRPLLVLAGIALVAAGALLALWAWLATSQAEEVVAVRDTVMRGEVFEASDLMTVQVAADPVVQVLPGSDLAQFVGQRAARDVPAGSLLTAEAVTQEVMPTDGSSVVGLALTPAVMPGEPLLVGDAVRVVGTAGGQGDPATVAPEVTFPAEVVGVTSATELGQSVVSVTVPAADAPVVARWAASGRVALVLDSRGD